MAQELSLVGAGDKLALPAHLQARFGNAPSTIITDGARNTLGIRAKKFTVSVGGESQVVQRKDEDSGDMVPVATLPVVILDYAVKMGRSYYASAFDPNVQSQPDCWSLDGVIPEPEVVEKQAPRCSSCPMAVKGSKMNDGIATMACSVHRVLAVVPVRKLDLPPLALRIAQTSDYDGQNPEAKAQGYFAFKQYLEALKSRGIPGTSAVVTNLSFDQSQRISYPKLFFRASRWLEPAEDAVVTKILDGGGVREILGWTGVQAKLAGEDHRPEVDPATVERVAARSAGAQDGRFAGAEGSLGEKVDTRAAQKEKATAAASAKQGGKASDALPEGFPDPLSAPKPQTTAGFTDPKPVQGPTEDDDDFAIRMAGWNKKRKKWEAEQAEKAAAEKPKPAATAAKFEFRAMEEGEDEDDYNIAKAQARKAWVKAGAGAAPAKPVEFVPPARQDDEDDDDFAIRVAQARKAHKQANGGAAPVPQAKKTVEAEPVPKGEEKPASAFGGMDLGGDDDGPKAPATASAEPPKRTRGGSKAKSESAKAPTEAVVAAKIPDDVDNILNQWAE